MKQAKRLVYPVAQIRREIYNPVYKESLENNLKVKNSQIGRITAFRDVTVLPSSCCVTPWQFLSIRVPAMHDL